MQIINHLANASINYYKKDSFATKISIFLAVILLGTVIFIISDQKKIQHEYITSVIGDYNVSISGIDKNIYNILKNDSEIKKLDFDKITKIKKDTNLLKKSKDMWNLNSFDIKKGKKPSKDNEIIVPLNYIKENQNLDIGSILKTNIGDFKISGFYDDHSYSFEEFILLGYLGENENLFEKESAIISYIWYKNPRDTYTNTRKILNEIKLDEKKSLSTGKLFYNKDILQYNLIYPNGIFPPLSVISKAIETYGALFILSLLFAVMIYGAFNVFNFRDIRQICLLKSAGMTKKQIKKMVKIKAFKLSILPIIFGIISSYFLANILLYLMYLNNSISYKNISEIFGQEVKAQAFKIVHLSFPSIILILALSFVTVFISALIPAKKSAEINITDGLRGIYKKNLKISKSSVDKNINLSLAKDYFKAYSSSYKTIIISIIISAMAMDFVLISQAYRSLNQKYDNFKSPYDIQCEIFSKEPLKEKIISDIKNIKGLKDAHIYLQEDFKIFPYDNEEFFSKDLKTSLSEKKKLEDEIFARIYALSDEDFKKIKSENSIPKDTNFLLLNSTPDDRKSPYSFRKYINITDTNKELSIRYSAKSEKIKIKNYSFINSIPFDIDEHEKNAVCIFTNIKNLENIDKQYKKDSSYDFLSYNIKIKTIKKDKQTYDQFGNIISSNFSKSDYNIKNEILTESANREQKRNENLLNLAVQSILLIIAVSNAYNSFSLNIRSRKKEFFLLETVGMTKKQIKKMLYFENILLFKTIALAYIFVFSAGILIRALKSSYNTLFAAKKLIFFVNYTPFIMVFSFVILSVFLSTKQSIKKIFEEK